MFFLIFNNANIQFVKKKLILRFYTNAKALSNIKQIEIINKKEFAKRALNKNIKDFEIYITFFSLSLMLIKSG